MMGQIRYQINFEEIGKNFKFKETGGLSNSPGKKFKLLPYNTKNATLDFRGVVGAFSRSISNKEIKEDFNVNLFLDKAAEKIKDYKNENAREKFKDIIKTMFVEGDKLANFNIKSINYISSTKQEEVIANFIISVLYDDLLYDDICKLYCAEEKNLLNRLVLQSLPEAIDKYDDIEKFNCYIPFIKELFIEDLLFLIQNEQIYKNYIKRFIEYYYMFYVSQLSLKLSRFEKADLTKPDIIYYTLDWEKTSKNRTAYTFGWKHLELNINDLFYHAITLELLNHHGKEKQLSYIELYSLFNCLNEDEVSEQINKIIKVYKNQLENNIGWSNFECKENIVSDKLFFGKVYELFNTIKYTFKFTRRGKDKNYSSWFTNFAKQNFAKRRGQLGYNLNITEEDIIFLTKICIKNCEKIKLNLLFGEFEKRGVFFDKDSKEKVIQLYEKLNILEKKSDSGDAQYVKSIL